MKKTILLVMSTLISMALTGCLERPDKAQAASQAAVPQGIPVKVEMPTTREITEWDEYTGRFQASQRAELRARVSGYLREVRFKDGQIVNKGDVLFVIDQRPFDISVESAQARFALANNEFNRAKRLLSSQSISEEAYDQRRQELRIAKAELNNAQLNLEFTEIKAPFTGRISRSLIDIGNLVVSDNTLLTTLIAADPIEFYYEGSESDYLRYVRARSSEEGGADRISEVPVYLRLQDEEEFVHEGKINFIDNELAEDTGTITVRAVISNTEGLFEPGMFGKLRVAQGGPKNVIVVPQHAIGTEQTRKYIYSLDKEKKAYRKYVKLGRVTKDGLQVVRSGLTVEDLVIVGGLHMVRPGVLIQPINENANAKATTSVESGASS